MSILLDAVSRAKQQSEPLDPVITPRAQLQAVQQGSRLWLKALLFVLFLLLAVLSAWLLSRANATLPAQQLRSGDIKAPQSREPQALHTDLLQAKPSQTDASQTYAGKSAQVPSVQLAGKVALPVAVARPSTSVQGSSKTINPLPRPQQNLAANSSTIAMATEDESIDEPIILGANSNQRGQQLLSSLKAQVDQAANDVGLESKSVSKSDSPPVSVDPSDQLLAAFQAALSEVEKDNALAKPVTEPKLDPIPNPEPDQLPKYGQLPAGVQLQVPQFNILAHVYSSNPDNRWLNVDGAELQEGDTIGGKLKIIEIRPRDVVLEVAGTQFKVPAI